MKINAAAIQGTYTPSASSRPTFASKADSRANARVLIYPAVVLAAAGLIALLPGDGRPVNPNAPLQPPAQLPVPEDMGKPKGNPPKAPAKKGNGKGIIA